MNTPSPTDLLAQIAQIQLMERGKLCPYTFKERAAPATPYYKLQGWENGKNVTRYIRSEQVPLMEAALAGHAQFQDLVEQYAQRVIAQTRERLATVGVKKKPGRRPGSSWRRGRKSRS
jgi:branched-subunit amino acid aminotransferase/4-amino-4-deoxychorismate lyase